MFNTSRLIVARQRRGLTKKELAEKIGVDPRAVSGFEAGEYTPTDDNLGRIARVLGFPIGFFQLDDVDIPDESGASFRAMSKMSSKQRNSAVAASAIAFELDDWIRQRFSLPVPNLLDLPNDAPELAALALRQYWDLGDRPVKNMLHLLEAKGVRVFSLAENCVEVDAYSLWRDGIPYVFLNTMKSAERRRFDAAHELAHLVLHKHGAPNGLEAEKEANAFASAFLMPKSAISASGLMNPSIDNLLKLKKKWNVSLAALAYRLHDLGLMTDWNYRELYIEMQRRGWRKSEPMPSPGETSQVWQKVFAALRGIDIGIPDLARELMIPENEIVKLVFGLVTVGLPASVSPRLRSGQRAQLHLVK